MLHFVYIIYIKCGFVYKWLYTCLIQLIRVLSGYDYICLVDCYSVSATISTFLSSMVTLVISLCGWTYQTETAMWGGFYSATITLVPPVTLVLYGLLPLHPLYNIHVLLHNMYDNPSVYLFHHDLTLMAWLLIWYYLIALCMFIWVVTEQGPHQGDWALCCLGVRVMFIMSMFIMSIRVNLYIKPWIFMCAFL